MKAGQLKKHHITKWTGDNPNWSDTATNDAIAIVQGMLNGAFEEGFVPIIRFFNPANEPQTEPPELCRHWTLGKHLRSQSKP
ncbi:hypothetical protein [Roseimaritima multifibrata]|uniref:hypothetical protein n=1 Tax=Roseimaritima multifibrata TaxID=1930274 RepID=UPI0011A8CE65|nr:hypothetical protein [Roseimaritima multifibrata]